MSLTIFKGSLTSGFQASDPVTLKSQALTLLWDISATDADVTDVDFYLEYTDENPLDANTIWYPEVDEQDTGDGEVTMSLVLRTFQLNGGASLPLGSYRASTLFTRKAQFARVQVRVSDGAANLTLKDPFSDNPQSP